MVIKIVNNVLACQTFLGNGGTLYNSGIWINNVPKPDYILVEKRISPTAQWVPQSRPADYDIENRHVDSDSGYVDSFDIRFVNPVPITEDIRVTRLVPIDQPYSFKDSSVVSPEKVEEALDFRAFVDQELKCDIEDLKGLTSIFPPPSTVVNQLIQGDGSGSWIPTVPLQTPTGVADAGKLPAVNSTGTGFTLVSSHSGSQPNFASNPNTLLGVNAGGTGYVYKPTGKLDNINAIPNPATTQNLVVNPAGVISSQPISSSLPPVTSGNDDEVLQVKSGAWDHSGWKLEPPETSDAGRVLVVDSSGNAVWQTVNGLPPSSGVNIPLLGDGSGSWKDGQAIPQAGAGDANKVLAVNAGGTGLEFKDAPSGLPPIQVDDDEKLLVADGINNQYELRTNLNDLILSSGIIQGCDITKLDDQTILIASGQVLYVSDDSAVPDHKKILPVAQSQFASTLLATERTIYIYVDINYQNRQTSISESATLTLKNRGNKILIGIIDNPTLGVITSAYSYIMRSDSIPEQLRELQEQIGTQNNFINVSKKDANTMIITGGTVTGNIANNQTLDSIRKSITTLQDPMNFSFRHKNETVMSVTTTFPDTPQVDIGGGLPRDLAPDEVTWYPVFLLPDGKVYIAFATKVYDSGVLSQNLFPSESQYWSEESVNVSPFLKEFGSRVAMIKWRGGQNLDSTSPIIWSRPEIVNVQSNSGSGAGTTASQVPTPTPPVPPATVSSDVGKVPTVTGSGVYSLQTPSIGFPSSDVSYVYQDHGVAKHLDARSFVQPMAYGGINEYAHDWLKGVTHGYFDRTPTDSSSVDPAIKYITFDKFFPSKNFNNFALKINYNNMYNFLTDKRFPVPLGINAGASLNSNGGETFLPDAFTVVPSGINNSSNPCKQIIRLNKPISIHHGSASIAYQYHFTTQFAFTINQSVDGSQIDYPVDFKIKISAELESEHRDITIDENVIAWFVGLSSTDTVTASINGISEKPIVYNGDVNKWRFNGLTLQFQSDTNIMEIVASGSRSFPSEGGQFAPFIGLTLYYTVNPKSPYRILKKQDITFEITPKKNILPVDHYRLSLGKLIELNTPSPPNIIEGKAPTALQAGNILVTCRWLKKQSTSTVPAEITWNLQEKDKTKFPHLALVTPANTPATDTLDGHLCMGFTADTLIYIFTGVTNDQLYNWELIMRIPDDTVPPSSVDALANIDFKVGACMEQDSVYYYDQNNP